MNPIRRLRFRLLTLVVVATSAAGLATGLAFARADSSTVTSPSAGVVVIQTSLGYQQAQGAGTGMVLTSNGVVLTNNHVIRGATSIKVVVPQTNRTYTATVAGYSVVNDTAVLKLQNASRLATVTLGNSAKVKLGQLVRAIGNAGGTGTLTTVRGRITGLKKSITVSDEQGGTARLTSLIETSAPLQPGDSGGPLFDASNRVIGMNTAASVTGPFRFEMPENDAYAIPINRAVTIKNQILTGKSSATVHVGATAFLGISVAQTESAAAVVADVVSGSPADEAGLSRGYAITAIDGQTVTSPTTIVNYLLQRSPGDMVTLTVVDPFGQQQTVTATLAAGPPQ